MFKKSLFAETLLGVFVVTLGLCSVGLAVDPVGWWTFDDAMGYLAADFSGNGYHGTVGSFDANKVDPVWVAGVTGGALEFNGFGFIDIPSEAWNANIFEGYTVCFWSHTDVPSQRSSTILALNYKGLRNLNLHTPWYGSIYFDTRSDSESFQRISLSGNRNQWVSQWSHWTFTYTPGKQEIYLNGKLLLRGTGTDTIQQDTKCFTIGAGGNCENYSHGFIGTIDDVRLYNVVLTPEEIEAVIELVEFDCNAK
jgi:hypothetical protein